MQPYKGYFIDGSALMVHPFSPDWYVGGSVLVSGRSGSVVEIGRFQLHQFTVSIKGLAEWFGLEVARTRTQLNNLLTAFRRSRERKTTLISRNTIDAIDIYLDRVRTGSRT
jgi:hypothetical protein